MTKTRSSITTHVLDTSRGKAAAGVPVKLEFRESEAKWITLGEAITNRDGRVEDLLLPGRLAEAGVFRLTFETAVYFRAVGGSTFYPFVTVIFEVVDAGAHYHVPLLLNPYGYSTYRGT